MTDARTVLFVCEHGALRSRLAAAWFSARAPSGWRATSAGLQPDETVSPHAARLLAGTPAEAGLDRSPPSAIPPASAILVAIDCALPGAIRWDLTARQPGDAMRDEIADRVQALIAELDHQ